MVGVGHGGSWAWRARTFLEGFFKMQRWNSLRLYPDGQSFHLSYTSPEVEKRIETNQITNCIYLVGNSAKWEFGEMGIRRDGR